jgi:hypothetical protein
VISILSTRALPTKPRCTRRSRMWNLSFMKQRFPQCLVL